jgi:hypothetical protein
LLDLVDRESGEATPRGLGEIFADAKQIVMKIKNEELKVALSVLVNDAESEAATAVERAQVVGRRLENMYDDAMRRVGGWYKRDAQLLSLVIGFAVAGLTNADAIFVTARLWADASLRASATAAADTFQISSAGTTTDSKGPLDVEVAKELEALRASTLPMGWPSAVEETAAPRVLLQQRTYPGYPWWLALAGWFVTALAASLGAPFWFDLLTKVMHVRGSGLVPASALPARQPSISDPS